MKIALTGLSCLTLFGGFAYHDCFRPIKIKKPRIQLALLLDTSGSMQGLIDQAKTQLWKIVNDFSTFERHGLSPDIEVALYEYGKSTISVQEKYLRMILPLTTDLDRVSEQLFALQTNGGDEYCGEVIQSAVSGLNWSSDPNDMKVVFIAGNEPFTQGSLDYRIACANAVRKGIVVNTIHCGDFAEGVRTNWKDGADIAEGKYFHIDQNRRPVLIDCPMDAQILQLNIELNKTYIPYGSLGSASAERQKMQDQNATDLSPAACAERAVTKSTGNYRNDAWDLVDATKNGKCKLSDLKKADLPPVMQAMDLAAQEKFVAENAKTRVEIQQNISKLNEARAKFIEEKMKELASGGSDTLDVAMINALREQARKHQFATK